MVTPDRSLFSSLSFLIAITYRGMIQVFLLSLAALPTRAPERTGTPCTPCTPYTPWRQPGIPDHQHLLCRRSSLSTIGKMTYTWTHTNIKYIYARNLELL